ncbi:anaerobic C4-dicarboxylate transporter family protein [Vagococcus jeotgali]|uniref:anaerobic C4-dicarboxylate transporter family protein n=1 Tax=Vagococcus jeotgali TaxID=3109030 RepID=UPI002DD87419|nr:anaerobic C4-dicarboxylate transporter family protein [Vagococcus sp. B2T-5]
MALLLIELVIMVATIIYGLMKGGALGAGVTAIVALFIMIFIFKLPPSAPPVTAVLIILSIGVASATLQASGGMEYMISVAEKIIRRYPRAITFVAPLVCFLFVFGMGTAMITLSLEPIISETAIKSKVNPKGALVTSVLASNMALLCSPASSSTAYVVTILAAYGISLGTYLSITLPATLISIVLLSLILTFAYKRIPFDESAIAKLSEDQLEVREIATAAKKSTIVFLLCVLAIIVLGLFPSILPTFEVGENTVRIATADLVQMFMYLSVAVNILFFKIKAKDILATSAIGNFLAAALIVLGLGWVGGTIFNAPINQAVLGQSLGQVLAQYPWVIILICSFVAMIIGAQTAVAAIIFPLALTLGISPLFLVVIVQCLNFNFVIPAQPTLLFAVELDHTGKTKVFSFIIPGIIITALAILLSYGITLFI